MMKTHTILLQFFAIAAILLYPAPADAQLVSSNDAAAEEKKDERQPREGAAESSAQSTVSDTFQPTALGPNSVDSRNFEEREDDQDNILGRNNAARSEAPPSEFETYVNEFADREVARFGENLLLPSSRDFAAPTTAAVPPSYVLNVGDIVVLYLTGSVSGTVEREIDNDGNIFLPSVGTVQLAGVRYADLRQTIIEAIGREYRYFNVSVSIKSLRGIRVYVTGFANNPGAFSVSSLSTLTNAVFQAGGPSAGGSFRSVKLYRNGREVVDFDLYQMLRGANRSDDVILQNEDVLFIPPAGEQVAVLGSVQDEAIYELLPGETLAQALTLAGGPSVMGETDRLILYRSTQDAVPGALAIDKEAALVEVAMGGDIIEVLSQGSLIQPISRQNVIVRIEGEVNRPGNYYVPPNTPVQQLLEMAGGTSSRAFLYGSRLERRSVRVQQQQSYLEAIEQLEFTLASSPLVNSNDGNRASELAAAQQLLSLLRSREPDGRVVMNVAPAADTLPPGVLLEPNDRLYIPARPSTVGVFGAVYRPGSFLIEEQGLKLRDYIKMAGDNLRAADSRRSFVVRANGEVLTRSNGMLNAKALPGDVVFVPVRTSNSDFFDRLRDITSVLFQLGITAAAVNSL